jgi:hypothetical protein
MPRPLCSVLPRPKTCGLKDLAAFCEFRTRNKGRRPYILTVDRFGLGRTPTCRAQYQSAGRLKGGPNSTTDHDVARAMLRCAIEADGPIENAGGAGRDRTPAMIAAPTPSCPPSP